MEEAKGKYILPNDVDEIVRMTHQHEWVKGNAGGLLKAPIDTSQPGLRILDSATADGKWLLDISATVPADAKLVGFDIAPELFPPANTTPGNVELTVQDLFKPFPSDWQASFDLVHQRFILPSFQDADLQHALRQLVSAIKPGGWLQLVEPDATARISDPKAQAFETFSRITEHVMLNPNSAPKAVAYLKELGLVDIKQETFDMAIGKGNPDVEVGEHGRKNFCAVLARYMEACEPAAFGLSTEQWLALPDQLAADMGELSTAMRLNFIYGRKPAKE